MDYYEYLVYPEIETYLIRPFEWKTENKYNVYVKNSLRGVFFLDDLTDCWCFAFGNSLRGRIWYTREKQGSIISFKTDIARIYNV